MLKTVSNVPVRFPDYGMSNSSNVGFPLPAAPKGLEKGHSFNGIMLWIKTVINGGILVHEPNKYPWYSTSTFHP